jgi:hypothetical protein
MSVDDLQARRSAGDPIFQPAPSRQILNTSTLVILDEPPRGMHTYSECRPTNGRSRRDGRRQTMMELGIYTFGDLVAQHEALGTTRFVGQIDIGGQPFPQVAKGIAIFATKVAPVIRAAIG